MTQVGTSAYYICKNNHIAKKVLTPVRRQLLFLFNTFFDLTMNPEQDCQLHRNGQRILGHLSEAIQELLHLETVCQEHRDAISQCEQTLESVAVDVACISTNGGEWEEMSKMIREAGIEIPEDLDMDMRKLFAGDDSCLK